MRDRMGPGPVAMIVVVITVAALLGFLLRPDDGAGTAGMRVIDQAPSPASTLVEERETTTGVPETVVAPTTTSSSQPGTVAPGSPTTAPTLERAPTTTAHPTTTTTTSPAPTVATASTTTTTGPATTSTTTSPRGPTMAGAEVTPRTLYETCPGAPARTVAVSVHVSDPDRVASVTAEVEGAASGRYRLSVDAGRATGTIGPFPAGTIASGQAAVLQVQLVAVDGGGATSTTDAGTLTLYRASC